MLCNNLTSEFRVSNLVNEFKTKCKVLCESEFELYNFIKYNIKEIVYQL